MRPRPSRSSYGEAMLALRALAEAALLVVCACTYAHRRFGGLLLRFGGPRRVLWKAARIGERASPWVSAACLLAAAAALSHPR